MIDHATSREQMEGEGSARGERVEVICFNKTINN